ncbi:MAG: ABC transporter permease [Chloroflexi bacterium]|nr:ABC transporter permease [Chloroflexota bacterium]
MRVGRGLELGLLAPLSVLLVGLVVVPTIVLVGYSLFEWVFASPQGALTLANYQQAIGDPITWRVILTTLSIGVPVAVLSTVSGFALAYYMVFGTGRGRRLLFVLTVTALMASFLVRLYAWRTLLGSNGVVNGALVSLGIVSEPLDFILFSRTAVVIAEVSVFTPIAALTFFAALSGIPPQLREAARDLGASRTRTLFRVTLPLSGPSVLATGALVFFLAAGDYLTPVFVGGPDSVTIGRLVADAFSTQADYGKGAALSVMMLIGFVALYLGMRFVMRASGLLPRRVT